MGSLMDQLGEALAGIAAQPVVRVTTTALGIYIVIVWLATAWWVFRDMRRRHGNPVLPYIAAGGVVAASPLLFLLALLVYRVIRPATTLAERRETRLEDRLTHLTLSSALACPICATAVDEEWLACPRCRTKLASTCPDCGQTMALDWTVCAWCGWEPARPLVLDVPQVELAGVSPEAAFAAHRTEVAQA